MRLLQLGAALALPSTTSLHSVGVRGHPVARVGGEEDTGLPWGQSGALVGAATARQ